MLKLPDGDFEGYIFDLDGTLADTMPLHFRAWQAALGESAGDFPEEVFYSWGGVKTPRIVELLNEQYGRNHDVEAMVRVKERWFLDHLEGVQVIQCVADLVEQWRGKKPMAIASGGLRRVILTTLEALHLRDAFPVIIGAEDVVHGKPDPEPFLKAASLLGVNPRKCLVFEDSPTGIKAAEAAGMQWVEITRQMR